MDLSEKIVITLAAILITGIMAWTMTGSVLLTIAGVVICQCVPLGILWTDGR